MKSGLLLLPQSTQPGSTWFSSMRSLASLPKFGEPQTRMLSFVCSGPFTSSCVMKLMSVQPFGRSWRGLSQLSAAQARSAEEL